MKYLLGPNLVPVADVLLRGYVTIAQRQWVANPFTLERLAETCLQIKPSVSLLLKANNEKHMNVNMPLTGMRFGHHANLWKGSVWYYSKALSRAASWCLLHIFPSPKAPVAKPVFLPPSMQEKERKKKRKRERSPDIMLQHQPNINKH